MKTILYTLSLCLLLGACSSSDTPEPSPSERTAEHIRRLSERLVSVSAGWRLTYFSRADSLLFSSPKSTITPADYRGHYGYGGHYYTLQFMPDGTVQMRSDTEPDRVYQSEYRLGQNTFTQLSFTTASPMHRLVNDQFWGSSDFLFLGEDLDGRLLWSTARYNEPAREYIVMEPVAGTSTPEEDVHRAQQARARFEQMVNPQLRISRGSRVFFESNLYLKRRVITNMDLLEEMERKRYHLFIDAPPTKSSGSGLGSGYVGTERGIKFFPGLRYSSKYVFRDFEYIDGRYRCELVSVYDMATRTTRLESKHLYPKGEPTGYVAEIWDLGDQK